MNDSHRLMAITEHCANVGSPGQARCTGLGLLREGIAKEGCEKPSQGAWVGACRVGRRERSLQGQAGCTLSSTLKQPPEGFLVGKSLPPSGRMLWVQWPSGHFI